MFGIYEKPTKAKNIENLQKWFNLDQHIDYKNMTTGVRYFCPFVCFQYKDTLSREELIKLIENQFLEEICIGGGHEKEMLLLFRIPPQYEEELKQYKDYTEVLIGRSGIWPFDK
jgi:hypothetical protein